MEKSIFFKPRLDELFLQTSDSNFAVNKELGILATITRSIHARLLLDVKDAEILHNVNQIASASQLPFNCGYIESKFIYDPHITKSTVLTACKS